MKMASIWKAGASDDPAAFTTWMGTPLTTVEIDFPLAAVFLTVGVPPQRLLKWLETDTTGPVTVQHLDDGRSVIAVGSKFDGFMLRSDFSDHLDFAVISTSSTPEKVRDLLMVAGRKKQ